MKKISKLSLAVLALAVVFAMAFVSCDTDTKCDNCGEDPCVCISVWTGTVTKEVFESASKFQAPTGNNFTTSQTDDQFTEAKRDTLVAGLKENKLKKEDLNSFVSDYIKNTMLFNDSQTAEFGAWFIASERNEYFVANNSGVYDIIVK